MNIYKRASIFGTEYIASCCSITKEQWDILMKGARKASRAKVLKVALLAGVIEKDTYRREMKNAHYNPYNHITSPKLI